MGSLRGRPLSEAGVITQLPTAKSDHEVVRTYGLDISIQLAGFQALSHDTELLWIEIHAIDIPRWQVRLPATEFALHL